MALIDEVIERQRRDDLENAFDDLESRVEDLWDVAKLAEPETVDLEQARAEVDAALDAVKVRLAQVLDGAA
jgi:hypothetical protein